MAVTRLTQRGFDVIIHGNHPMHVTQVCIEWSEHTIAPIHVTQDCIEHGQHNHFPMHVTQTCIEVAYKLLPPSPGTIFTYGYMGYLGRAG